ncbi:hypothetical protein NLX83_28150 [Allokutzneria sp. A3M-2-11 16]|uniref:hypothetical protein n=1 Tax=Allokutzneria sp. A3M-2-11 16 TaxID=2962043 RepID=UPI0020B68C3B|nr:hypothetical protein [Allokutzneria sp. A3M-2-11 16]MCP3803156.1 hypothetical protein [Allokutzneria sp. A3M-2-11 16]
MRRSRLPIPAAFGFPLGAALALIVTSVLIAIGAAPLSFIAMVVVVDSIAVLSTYRAALPTVAVCWALHSTFMIGEYGVLTISPETGNNALVLTLCAITALAFASTLRPNHKLLHRRWYHPRAWRIPEQRTRSRW